MPPLNATEEWHERTKKRLHEAEQAEETAVNLKRKRGDPVIIKPDSSESEPEPEPEPQPQPPPKPAQNSKASGISVLPVGWEYLRVAQRETQKLRAQVERLEARCRELEEALQNADQFHELIADRAAKRAKHE